MPTAAAAAIPSTVAAQMSRRQQGERCFLVAPVASDGCGGTVKLGMTRSSGLYALSVDCVGAGMVVSCV